MNRSGLTDEELALLSELLQSEQPEPWLGCGMRFTGSTGTSAPEARAVERLMKRCGTAASRGESIRRRGTGRPNFRNARRVARAAVCKIN
jgi:hypothetical protein